MQTLELYNLFLCLIVFCGLTALFAVLITMLVKNTLRIINAGLDDEKIKQEHIAEQSKKKNDFGTVFNNALLIFTCVVLCCVLAFSLYSRFTEDSKVGAIPTVKVVETGSMETKHEDNAYLAENNLNDQISTFDLVLLHQLPAEEDLKLWDIVVYETNGYYIIHRIIAIEEPNEKHPNERWFVLRGDANNRSDQFPVKYSQMCSIYRGESIPFLGAFVMFMQSPAGMLCVLLVIIAVIALPIVEKLLQKAVDARLFAMGLLGTQEQQIEVEEDGQTVAPVDGETENSTTEQADEVAVTVTTETAQSTAEQPADEANQAVVESTEEQGVVAVVPADDLALDASADEVLPDSQTDEIEQVTEESIWRSFGERKTFAERLALLDDERADWYNQLVYVLMQLPSIRVSAAKYHELYRQGNKAIAKIAIRGKSLYVYLPVDAANYQGVQYGYKDVSSVKSHGKLNSECKITSRRKLKNVLKILATYGEKVKIERPATGVDFFKLRKKLTLNQKLYRLPKDRRARYRQIVKLMEQKPDVTRWESKNCLTFKNGHKPLLKITVKGKTVCVFMAVDTSEYQAAKYGVKDVSTVKAYRDYPAMCKVTSDRRLKYVLQIINEKL